MRQFAKVFWGKEISFPEKFQNARVLFQKLVSLFSGMERKETALFGEH